nr:reverse transcriptase domain-containing protein [Tanacetum cinerariifolium]
MTQSRRSLTRQVKVPAKFEDSVVMSRIGDEYVNKEEGNAHNMLETRTVSNNIADLEKPNVNNIVDSENNDAGQSHQGTDWRIKEERKEACSVGWEIKERTVSARSESRYQSSRLGRTKSIPRKCHHECSRRTETLYESEDMGGIGSQGKRWKLLTRRGRKHFWYGSNRKLGENKILTEEEVSEISRDQRGAWTSKAVERTSHGNPNGPAMAKGGQSSDVTRATKERINVAIHPEYPEQTIAIGSTLTKEGQKKLCDLLRDLNKACPKDGYPLPEIDWKVESLCEYPFKCFLDAYKGYHQIKMAEEDEEKTTFITSQGIFWYSKMPFGLKNVEATYQRLVDKAFQKQIGGSHPKPTVSKMSKGCTKAEWIVRKPKRIPIQISRKVITILQNFKKVHKEDRFLMDYGSESCIQANEKANSRAVYANRTYGKMRNLLFTLR